MDSAGRRVRRVLGNAVSDRTTLANAVGGVSLIAMLVAVRVTWPDENVSPGGWWVAAALLTSASLASWLHPAGPRHARQWLWLAGISMLLAAIFWGANHGLDLIKPVGSRRHDAASTLGGIELWSLFCPGLTIVATAGLVRSLVLPSRRR